MELRNLTMQLLQLRQEPGKDTLQKLSNDVINMASRKLNKFLQAEAEETYRAAATVS